MTKRSTRRSEAAPADDGIRWGIVQVAAFLERSYQTTRNQMLQGRFGPSEYDARSRKLTVLASVVQRVKARANGARKRSD